MTVKKMCSSSPSGFSLKTNRWPINIQHDVSTWVDEPHRISDPQVRLKKAAMKLRNRYQQAVVPKTLPETSVLLCLFVFKTTPFT